MKKNIEKFKQFVSDNSSTIFKCVGGITLAAAAMLLDIPVEISPKKTPRYTTWDTTYTIRRPYTVYRGGNVTSQERAIASLLTSTKSMAFDSDRLKTAERIKDIAEESFDEDVHNAAISALEDISRMATFQSTKNEISGYIYDIATS